MEIFLDSLAITMHYLYVHVISRWVICTVQTWFETNEKPSVRGKIDCHWRNSTFIGLFWILEYRNHSDHSPPRIYWTKHLSHLCCSFYNFCLRNGWKIDAVNCGNSMSFCSNRESDVSVFLLEQDWHFASEQYRHPSSEYSWYAHWNFPQFFHTGLIMPSFFTHIIDPFCAALDIPKDIKNANFSHALKFKLTHACWGHTWH